jgi:hypothetical protein
LHRRRWERGSTPPPAGSWQEASIRRLMAPRLPATGPAPTEGRQTPHAGTTAASAAAPRRCPSASPPAAGRRTASASGPPKPIGPLPGPMALLPRAPPGSAPCTTAGAEPAAEHHGPPPAATPPSTSARAHRVCILIKRMLI